MLQLKLLELKVNYTSATAADPFPEKEFCHHNYILSLPDLFQFWLHLVLVNYLEMSNCNKMLV